MIARALLLATTLIAASSATAVAQTQETFANRNAIAAPVLRANVQVPTNAGTYLVRLLVFDTSGNPGQNDHVIDVAAQGDAVPFCGSWRASLNARAIGSSLSNWL